MDKTDKTTCKAACFGCEVLRVQPDFFNEIQ
jgi:hypothetical protein